MRESARCSFSQLSPSVTLDARVARGRWTADACTDALARVCPASAPSTDDVGPDDALQPGLLSASWAAPNNPLWRGGLPSHAFLLRLFLSLLVGLTCTVDCWRGPAEAGVSAHASNPSPTARGVDCHRTAGRPPPRQGERPNGNVRAHWLRLSTIVSYRPRCHLVRGCCRPWQPPAGKHRALLAPAMT
jgi:hypothetical protein